MYSEMFVNKFIAFKDKERYYNLEGVKIGSKKINDVVLITKVAVHLGHHGTSDILEINFLNDLYECLFELFDYELWKIEIIETE